MGARVASVQEISSPAQKTGRSPGDEAVYANIFDAILENRLPPGTKLTEDGLGEIFGVSRTVVRKALLRLGHENMVRIRPNRGAVVASPSIEEARAVFETRRVLENAVVRRFAGNATAEQLDSLRELVALENDAHERGDRSGWIRLSGNFHVHLAEMNGNPVMVDFLRELVSRTSLIVAMYEAPGRSACASDEHLDLVDAIAGGDGNRAGRLMTAHLNNCENQLELSSEDEVVDLAGAFFGVSSRA